MGNIKTYDVHFRNYAEDIIQLTLTLHDYNEEERPADVIGKIMAESLGQAKFRLEKLLKREL